MSTTHALASLTATYTDSEPEGEEDEDSLSQDAIKKPPSVEDVDKDGDSKMETAGSNVTPSAGAPVQPTIPPTSQPQPSLEVLSRVAKLVSYHDDNVISDEEGETLGQRAEEQAHSLKISTETTGDVELPPEPSGRCSPRLVEKVMKLHEKMESGLDMNSMIQSRKDFRNPSIYEKLIQFCNLNELGTNYPASIYDPLKWGKESFYEELAKVQKVEMDRREKEKKERTKVEFVSGTKKPTATTNEDDLKKRKSKWDQVGSGVTGAPGMQMGVIRPAGLLQSAFTTSVTGTKGTVISAFGSLPKKPRI